MSELTSNKRHGGVGRALLWVAIVLTVALLGFVTAVAVRGNPIYSDREANGVSKYKFIEECRELLTDTEKLTVGAQGQAIPLKTLVEQSAPLAKGDELRAELEAEPAQIIRATENIEGGGWTLTAPATISVHSGSKTRALGQLPMQCVHPKGQETQAQLQLPGQ
ncbi:hypothetical protein [Deinococcus marmoris]|uniref:Uncharacterized protein n=1 Tax=Deinococcus marmoris TaxID=249408 RepID=A0A1U7P0Z9_9DEIO|nr:hypothetical protein [Deinococcus marmoris]OLV18836.1 hypothetical protein BOO71_0004885 [Deinococcus marmoris]